MLSFKTCIELINVIDNYIDKVVNRIFVAFDLEHTTHPSLGKFTKDDKINILLKTLKYPPAKGPLSDSFQIDLLQYMVDHFYRYEDEPQNRSSMFYDKTLDHIQYDDKFSYKYPALANSLKRDGYLMKGRTIRKMLPAEIEEAKTENELVRLLNKFHFNVSKGHLEQATDNHSQGNWAGANSQFRTFIESLLMEITSKLVPTRVCTSAGDAIQWLSTPSVLTPVFLSEHLNEVKHAGCNYPFVNGFWKRLHPHGSHPGLSDEEDSTFRYHITIVFARYLLDRLETRR